MSDLKATIETDKGSILLELYPEKTPTTVANFVNLAKRGYYKGISFHRVIDDFMVQTGCPDGNGMGGPGYQFDDEIQSDLTHNKPGILSMANAGPGTNGSQFFITHVETPWLDNNHSIFGQVIDDDDQDVVNSISQNDLIEEIMIIGELKENSEINQRISDWNETLDR